MAAALAALGRLLPAGDLAERRRLITVSCLHGAAGWDGVSLLGVGFAVAALLLCAVQNVRPAARCLGPRDLEVAEPRE